jgi:hypothetical protein
MKQNQSHKFCIAPMMDGTLRAGGIIAASTFEPDPIP